MNTKISNIVLSLIIILAFLIGLIVYPSLPYSIASHWNSAGEVNGYSSKFIGVFLMPIIIIVLSLLFYLIPNIDPFKKNVESFRNYYNIFWVAVSIFLFYIYLLTICWNLGYKFNFTTAIIPAFSGLFYFVGAVLEKSKRNWFFGIRTPWTLSSDEVWKKTHKLGAKLYKITALISLFGLFIRNNFSIVFIIFPIIIVSIYVSIYSYFEYKKELKS
jgi:uncharacterized membrane protein